MPVPVRNAKSSMNWASRRLPEQFSGSSVAFKHRALSTKDHEVSVQLNHTIVWCRDKQKSATFLVEILGLPPPTRFGPFFVVALGNDVSLDFHETDGEIAFQHYAFLVGEDEFD